MITSSILVIQMILVILKTKISDFDIKVEFNMKNDGYFDIKKSVLEL